MTDRSPKESKTQMDSDAAANKLSISILDQDHREPILTAISNIFTTDIAKATFAQIVDGLPLASVVKEYRVDPVLDARHPIYGHDELCPGEMEKTMLLQSDFDPDSLLFDSRLLLAYQAASPGSRSSNTRFIEIIANAVHQIAILLFRLETNSHQDDTITTWTPPETNELWWDLHPHGPNPTLFFHSWYTFHDQYPEGVADMVGYWAEARILGGVVLFNHRTRHSDAVFLHADRKDVTYRICKLRDDQKRTLLDFLLGKAPQTPCPLPILPDNKNTDRVDPEEPIAVTGIYRDRWERRDKPEYMGDARLKDVSNSLDYTSFREQLDSQSRAFDRRSRPFDNNPEAEF